MAKIKMKLLLGLIFIFATTNTNEIYLELDAIKKTRSIQLANSEAYFIEFKNGDNVAACMWKDSLGREHVVCSADIAKNRRSIQLPIEFFDTIKSFCETQIKND